MKLTVLAALFSTFLTTPSLTAPTPEPLELVLSIDTSNQPVSKHSQIPDAHVIFHGATPEAGFDLNVHVDGKTFKIDNPLSVSYITVQGFAGCVFSGVDGSKTLVKTYGYPSTVPVGPPQKQVSGFCVDPNRVQPPAVVEIDL